MMLKVNLRKCAIKAEVRYGLDCISVTHPSVCAGYGLNIPKGVRRISKHSFCTFYTRMDRRFRKLFSCLKHVCLNETVFFLDYFLQCMLFFFFFLFFKAGLEVNHNGCCHLR